MINEKENPVSWALLLMGLDEAKEHLENLINEMNEAGRIDECFYSAGLAHIYAHLNRAWHSRNQDAEITEGQWPQYSQFPKDIEAVG